MVSWAPKDTSFIARYSNQPGCGVLSHRRDAIKQAKALADELDPGADFPILVRGPAELIWDLDASDAHGDRGK